LLAAGWRKYVGDCNVKTAPTRARLARGGIGLIEEIYWNSWRSRCRWHPYSCPLVVLAPPLSSHYPTTLYGAPYVTPYVPSGVTTPRAKLPGTRPTRQTMKLTHSRQRLCTVTGIRCLTNNKLTPFILATKPGSLPNGTQINRTGHHPRWDRPIVRGRNPSQSCAVTAVRRRQRVREGRSHAPQVSRGRRVGHG